METVLLGLMVIGLTPVSFVTGFTEANKLRESILLFVVVLVDVSVAYVGLFYVLATQHQAESPGVYLSLPLGVLLLKWRVFLLPCLALGTGRLVREVIRKPSTS